MNKQSESRPTIRSRAGMKPKQAQFSPKLISRPIVESLSLIRVMILAMSICASDRRVLAQNKNSALTLGHTTLGHEAGGYVLDTHTSVPLGTKVVILPHLVDYSCHQCLAGKTNLCKNLRHVGFDIPGVLAKFTAVDPRLLVPVDPGFPNDALPLVEPTACALRAVTMLKGFLTALPPDSRIAVFGAGPMGALLALALRCRFPGIQVLMVDSNPERRKLVAELHIAQIEQRLPPRSVTVAIDATSTAGSAFDALAATHREGTVLFFAGKNLADLNNDKTGRLRFFEKVHRGELEISPEDSYADGRWLVGSSGYTRADVEDAKKTLSDRTNYWSVIQNVEIHGLSSREAHFLRPVYEVRKYDRPAVEVFLDPAGLSGKHGVDLAMCLKPLIRIEETD